MIKAEEILVKDTAEAVRLALDSPAEDTNYLIELFDIESDADGEYKNCV